jgi:putative endonuclease
MASVLLMFYTYILRNKLTKRYYIGYTPDLKNRIKAHKEGEVKLTKSNLNYSLEWYCAFKTKSQAQAFERYLKTGSGIAFMRKRFFKSDGVA